MLDVAYLIAAAAVTLGSWRLAAARRPLAALLATVVGLLAASLLPAAAPLLGLTRPSEALFVIMRWWAWGAFAAAPIALLGQAWLARSAPPAALALALVGVGAEAFVRQPYALQVTRHTIVSANVTSPLRIAVLADIQTDRVGDHERRAVALTLAAEPDLILLPGDFVQRYDDQRPAELRALAEVLAELTAPLGVHAVAGNSEEGLDDWAPALAAAGVTPYVDATTAEIAPGLWLTSLPLKPSFDPDLAPPPRPGLHIVWGHAPDFALSDARAELSIAGHTHGGQVRIPFFGPVVTFSHVPRAWAEGHTVVAPQRHLVVSRGVGMERGYAPRLRLFCPPEVVIIDVIPADAAADASRARLIHAPPSPILPARFNEAPP